MSNSEPQRTGQRLAWQVNPFCEALGISRTSFYELVKQNKIKTVVIAGRRLIPESEAQRLLSEAA
jgi:excisionase family DNA binding protein